VKVLVDSSGWVHFFAGGPLADRYAPHLTRPAKLITPTVVIYEVYKRLKRELGEERALVASGKMSATEVIPLTEPIAFLAADLSLAHGLAMADAIIYATARYQDAQLITSDADLKDLPGVLYLS
jgi:predicted nucleic acid-binding protein